MIHYANKKVTLRSLDNGDRVIEADGFGTWTIKSKGIRTFNPSMSEYTYSDIMLIKNYLEDFDNVWNAYKSGDEIVHVGGVSNRWYE
jgi:hypothetical protein